ncbi:MAG: hypothetical protein JW723_04275 [Bacteroidales bacterium]|nr:hypothetical protein [Bacteroidales bacterium]
MICRRILGLAIVFLITAAPLASQQYSKRIVKKYKVNNSTTIDIYNKYGKIYIVTWEKDSVSFNIDLKINASSESKLNKLKSNVDFDFTGTEYYVIAKTRIGRNTNSVISDLADIAGSILSSDNKVTIDYLVKMPKHLNLKLENKFGDVYIDDFDGNINLTLSNGELKANNLNGNAVISVSSGDGIVNSIREGKLIVSYSDFAIKEADKLSVESRSSRINIEQADFLKLSSRRDKINLPEIYELYGESYWSDFTIHQLGNELNLNLNSGNISIDNIRKGFSFINITSEYTDIDLVFERTSVYAIDITHHQDMILNYPRQLASLQTKVINEEDRQELTYGKIGSGSSASKVKITAPKKCTVNIIHK